MAAGKEMSGRTRLNWLIDCAVFLGAVVAMLSGFYFLFAPPSGRQGGRNPWYGFVFLFERHTWSDLHTWGGLLMIGAVVVHLSIHGAWLRATVKRIGVALRGAGGTLSAGARRNLVVDAVIASCFVVCALTGLYLWLLPSGGHQGGTNPGWDPGFLVSRATWNLIHAGAGVVLASAAVLHIAIHWGWIEKVTRRFFAPVQVGGRLAPSRRVDS